MPSDNGLKVCTFNAECDDLDYKCCIKDSCYKNTNEVPDSLVAAMIAVAILPGKADIYNIQNVKNKNIVEYLIKEICRVKQITDEVAGTNADSTFAKSSIFDIACRLNSFDGLTNDGDAARDALLECDKYKVDYVDLEHLCLKQCKSNACGSNSCGSNSCGSNSCGSSDSDEFYRMLATVRSYSGVSEYDAYHNGSSLTLVKKSLRLCPEVKCIPCVDSIVLFYEHCDRKLINVNVNLGGLVNSFDDLGCRKKMVDSVVCFLKEHKECGSVIMSGCLGDLDYDTPQLLYRGDAEHTEMVQRYTATGVGAHPVPADFPCDLEDPLYECMEFLMKTCNAESIPYSWLLQYLRIKGCKKCCLYKLVCGDSSKCTKSCKSCPSNCSKPCCKVSKNKCNTPDHMTSLSGCNRSHLRQQMRKSDRGCFGGVGNKKDKTCNKSKPVCASAKKCCRDAPIQKCKTDCKDNEYLVKVDFCKKEACCNSCENGGKCEDEKVSVCPPNACDSFDFCDAVTVLKRDLHMYNTLNKIDNVNNRYTCYSNHFNRQLDCKFPKGIFQAWAMCEEYEKPRKPSRIINNNSELLALDHILVSNSLKNHVTCASMSDLCIEKCGYGVGSGIYDRLVKGKKSPGNTLSKRPFVLANNSECCDPSESCEIGEVIPNYSGSVVKSFFTHRLYCVHIELPVKRKQFENNSSETLHGLGLTSLWSALCNYTGSDCIDVSAFADFGLDKHHYFRDYFWKCITNKFSSKIVENGSSGDFANRILNKFADCNSEDIMYCVAKNQDICEEDFYRHMLCVLSNTDNRDRFVINVGIMDALFKISVMPEAMVGTLGEKCGLEYEVVRSLLCNVHVITKLFDFLSKCFGDKIKTRAFLDNYSNIDSSSDCGVLGLLFGASKMGNILNGEPVIVDVGCENKKCVGQLLSVLDYCLCNNCAVMEILTRYAVRSLGEGNCDNDMLFFSGLSCEILQCYADMLCLNDDTASEQVLCMLKLFIDGQLSAEELVDSIVKLTDKFSRVLVLLIMAGTPFRTFVLTNIKNGTCN